MCSSCQETSCRSKSSLLAAVFGTPFDKAHLSLFAHLHSLLLDLFGNRQVRIGYGSLLLLGSLLHPSIERVSHQIIRVFHPSGSP